MTIPGATGTGVFRACVREVLCPTLRPGDLVVMDNPAPHKSDPPLELIEAAGVPKSSSCPPAHRTSIRLKKGEQGQIAAAQRRSTNS